MPPNLLKAVLDTTILVSAFLTPGGLSSEILRFARLNLFECVSSDGILEETRLSLLQKNHIRHREISNAIAIFCNALENYEQFTLQMAYW